MVQPIILYSKSHNVLTTPVKLVTTEEDHKESISLIQDLKDTLESVGGLGLAANQIGRNLSICVCKIGESIITMINPSYEPCPQPLGEDVTEISEEACLSLPDVVVKIPRYKDIYVSFVNPDADWEYQSMFMEFPNSVIAQHEIDHLNGIINIDYLTPLQINLLGNKLKRIARGNVPINYVGMIWKENKRSWNLIGSHLKLLEFYSYQNKIQEDATKVLEKLKGEITGSLDNSIITGDNNGTEESNSSQEIEFETEEDTTR